MLWDRLWDERSLLNCTLDRDQDAAAPLQEGGREEGQVSLCHHHQLPPLQHTQVRLVDVLLRVDERDEEVLLSYS